jgi:ATP-binding cassette subfamily C protein PrsD
VTIEGASLAPPGSTKIVLQDVNLKLRSGDGLGIIGPSASGKSSLVKMLVGAWQPARGNVCLDGAALEQWTPDALGLYLGYLPQEVELLAGTVAENISRFEPEPDAEAIVAAAKAAGVHELIAALSDGYSTQVGEQGAELSAGQRQWIALARALYRDPFLVVLDEPNSNLDSSGEEALTRAILGVRNRGGVAVVVAHRPSALAALNSVLVLNQGRIQALGPKDEVLAKVLRRDTPRPLKVVPDVGATHS